ncbi:MAG: TraB/GumN family protein [Bacteroidia bacterium]|nr:TraB/GumN family protein [Bacteroidia bacterium]
MIYPKNKLLFTLLVGIVLTTTTMAQTMQKGLLWEITGNGLNKPSYLYGTMHVSSKLAFNLSDSFFIAIKNCDRVALESSPENWLEEFLSTDFMSYTMRANSSEARGNDNPISINDFTWFKEFYAKGYIKQALARDPDVLNQLMFRHSSSKQDFEEDTYLDLYIFQTASRLKKPVVSVEDLDESLKLVMQSYTDMYPEDKERKYNKDFDRLLEEYYRQADLGKLDSLMQKQGYSETYFERMLYTRNNNMVHSMDSFFKMGSLFTGVGAAHLPGEKGVINLLRNMGYQVRAVNLGQRNAALRGKLDKIEVPVVYQKFSSNDGRFSVDVPGKLLVMPDNSVSQQYLRTDMMNGSFYSVNRIKTFAPFINFTEEQFKLSVDSLLYEYVPGDILSFKPTMVSGNKAYDITNKTKRGNLQRYRIVFTPFELFVFKAGGNGNYVKKNATQFFNSIVINNPGTASTPFSSKKEGFEINLPVVPLANFETSALSNYTPNSHIYQAQDANGINYFLLKQVEINTTYLEEDSVEINLVERGFLEGTGLRLASRGYKTISGYPFMICTYTHPTKETKAAAIYAIKGSHVYAFSAWCNTDEQLAKAIEVLKTFKFVDIVSEPGKLRVDTVHKFTVVSPVPVPPDVNGYNFSFKKRDAKSNHTGQSEYINYYDAETGERVELRWQRLHKYFMSKDSARFWKNELEEMNPRNDYKQKVTYYQKDGAVCADVIFTDTNTSRVLMAKVIIKGRYIYTLTSQTDSITMGNNFVREFFNTFKSTDTSNLAQPFVDKTTLILTDILSDDSTTYAQARDLIGRTQFQGKSYKPIADALSKLKEDKYKKELRIELVTEIGFRKDVTAIPYLQKAYNDAGDDYDYQVSILRALASINTAASYKACRDLLIADPPFASDNGLYNRLFDYIESGDSLWNRKQFMPTALKLAENDEYKSHVYYMLAEAIDSNKVTTVAYQPYLNSVINDAKKALKQELTDDEQESYSRNYDIEMYNRILVKHFDNGQVKEHFNKQLKAKNYHVKGYAIAVMLANKKAVDDTIIYNLASNIDSRLSFYFALKKYKQLDKFPKEFNKQTELVYCYARNMVKPSYGDNKLDTIILIDQTKTYFKTFTGNMYFFKFKLKKSDEWQTYTCGMQVTDSATYEFLYFMNGKTKEDFDEKLTIQEQFERAIETRKEAVRNNKYGNNNDDDDEDDY